MEKYLYPYGNEKTMSDVWEAQGGPWFSLPREKSVRMQKVNIMPSISYGILEELRGIAGPGASQKFLFILIEEFIAAATSAVSKLSQLCVDAEGLAVARAAHALKSTCSSLGAIEMHRLSHELEMSAIAEDRADYLPLLTKLQRELEKTVSEYRKVFNKK